MNLRPASAVAPRGRGSSTPTFHPHGSAAPEEDILRCLQAGDEPAFALFYDRYAPTIFSLLVRILREEAEAAELLPRIFLELKRELPQFHPERRSLFTWAVMSARKKAIARLRAKASEQGWVQAGSPSDHTLPGNGREESPLHLAFFTGLNAVEISARLRLPEKRVRGGIARDLRVRRARLAQEKIAAGEVKSPPVSDAPAPELFVVSRPLLGTKP